jgi:hypothetical protein
MERPAMARSALGGDTVKLLGEGHDVLQRSFSKLWVGRWARGAEVDVLTGTAVGMTTIMGLALPAAIRLSG